MIATDNICANLKDRFQSLKISSARRQVVIIINIKVNVRRLSNRRFLLANFSNSNTCDVVTDTSMPMIAALLVGIEAEEKLDIRPYAIKEQAAIMTAAIPRYAM